MAARHQLERGHLSEVRIDLSSSLAEQRSLGETRSTPEGTQNQADALEAENVEVARSALGELSVDFSVYGWFPDVLPSEEEEEAE